MGMLQAGAEWMARTLQKCAGARVVYSRGQQQVEISAVRIRAETRADENRGTYSVSRQDSWFMETRSLVLDGSSSLPARGDTIRETTEAGETIYEVLPPSAGDDVYRIADQEGRWLLVSTVRR